MTQAVDDLVTAVANETTVENSIMTLLDSVVAQLQIGIDAGDLKKIQDATNQLTANKAALAASIVKNTPADPNAPAQTPAPTA